MVMYHCVHKIYTDEDRLQQKTRLLEVQLQIHGFNQTLVKNDRFFVYNRQCQMKRRGLPGKKYKHIQIYLFNDLFLWVSARGRFKGSYSFYKENLEISIPSNCKKGDALFSIGLKSEKHKRLIVCADDLQRDKLMNTIMRTYKSCQKKYFQTLQSTNKDAIKQIKKRGVRDTNVKGDNELSSSSLDTRNTYNNEYSRSETDRTDITESIHVTPTNGAHKPVHSNGDSIPSSSSSPHHHHQNKPSNSNAGGGYTNPLSTVKENTGTSIHDIHSIYRCIFMKYDIHFLYIQCVLNIYIIINKEYNDRNRGYRHIPPPGNAGADAEFSVDDSATIQLNLTGLNGSAISPKSNATTPPTRTTSANVTPIAQDLMSDFPRTVNNIVKTRTITPEPSVEMNDEGKPSPITLINQPESNSVSVSESFSQSISTQISTQPYPAIPIPNGAVQPSKNGHGAGAKSHRGKSHRDRERRGRRDREHKREHKSRKKELIKELQTEIEALKQQLKIKDDRIEDLEQSNKTIRQTLILKDNKIHSLQDQVQHLSMRLTSHGGRAKSICMPYNVII